MKTKLLTICLLLFTSQVFAEIKSIQKLKNPDPIYVLERCAANTVALLQLVDSMKNKAKEEMDFQKELEKRFNFFSVTLVNYRRDQNKNLSKDEIEKITFTRIRNLGKTIYKDMKTSYFKEDMGYCKSIEEM